MMRTLLSLAVLLAVASLAHAEGSFAEIGKLDVKVSPAAAKPGAVVTVEVTVTPTRPGWHTYPTQTPPGQVGKNSFHPKAEDLVFVGQVVDPEGWVAKREDPLKPANRLYEAAATWAFKAVVSPKAPPGKRAFKFGPVGRAADGVVIQICKGTCLFASEADVPAVEFEVLPGPAEAVPAEYAAAVDAAVGGKAVPGPAVGPPTPPEEVPPGLVKKAALPVAEYAARLDALRDTLEKQDVKREGGIGLLLFTAAFWGLVSLATPCVFPMIPITVSLFLKQGTDAPGGAVKLAAIYCGTIVAVLGVSAVTLLGLFRALSIDPWMNLFLGGLFVVFALSLFGLFDITLPRFMLKYAEDKRKAGGVVGTVFGAVAFSIVSFTCVAPFLGGFAGMVSSGQYERWELVLAGLTFAAAFAAPFFVLALFPSLLKKLPKSGGWLDSVKVVMGFLEAAAALKFFRISELRWTAQPTLLTYDLVLAAWVVLSAVCGLYLLGLFRLPHDEERPNIGVFRLVFALLFLGFAAYLLPGLFKTGEGKSMRPGGVVFAWVDAFLLPDPPAAGNPDDLPWQSDLPDAIRKAREEVSPGGEPRPVFADFTGVTCTNCEFNEQNVFPQPRVKELLKKYGLVRMYTDDVPAASYTAPPTTAARAAEAKANLKFQKDAFGTEQLPLYAVFRPTPTGAQVVAVYGEGKINDPAAFAEFLAGPLGKK